jgi:preprotein translocase subunit SecG
MLILLQIIVSLALIALILIQERSSGLSSVFGGGGDTPYHTRRGMEKLIFNATVISGALFFVLAVLNLVL